MRGKVVRPSLYLCFFFAVVFFTAGFSLSGMAQDFDSWVKDFKKEALAKGIKQDVLDLAFEGVEPKSRIIELDRKQPEGTLTFARYAEKALNKTRIAQGRRLYAEHRGELEKVAKAYGVPAPYIVALWGIETSYGNNTGGFDVVTALATLAYDGRRSEFFRGELLEALRILQEGHITKKQMEGSWAGAMGQNQFMPSSFFKFAVDGDQDGRRDIWTSLPDVFSSTANYLHTSGWKKDERWGREVVLPDGFDQKLVGLEVQYPLRAWNDMGLRLPGGGFLPVAGMSGSVVLPDGPGGRAFLVYDNYRVIMKWNRSFYFATVVGLLADQIAQ
ncbi:MAG: lytic murein transglycosylase [Alphaproteobacteria bacterium]|nr:lytic murein transglycosylase [Alphaproteobacteria bacterium]